MLYCYPAAATSDNWLHCCLVRILLRVHDDLDANRTPRTWPTIIPEEYREKIVSRHGLKRKLKTYIDSLALLSSDEQSCIHETLIRQNQLRRLFTCRRNCLSIEQLPAGIQEPAKKLFEFAFDLLTPFGVRDLHYKLIYDSAQDKVCPFCGLEMFDAPGAPREDDDHYLPKSQYPFAAVNLWNLVPMGQKCNSRYKRAVDPLYNNRKERRRVTNPYGDVSFGVSLMRSIPFGAPDGLTPKWNIEFEPATEESETWNDIFDLRTRYQRDVLDPHWTSWLRQFSDYADTKGVANDTDLQGTLETYCRFLRRCGLSDRAFLKAALFEMLLDQFNQGNKALIRLILRIAIPT